jgi:hypothetical protein
MVNLSNVYPFCAEGTLQISFFVNIYYSNLVNGKFSFSEGKTPSVSKVLHLP